MMTRSDTHRWFLRCAAAAAALVLACGAATALLGSGPQLQLTTRDRNIAAIDRYFRGASPDLVLLGSSVAFRMSESFFPTRRVRNLALAGGTAMTGLEILATAERLPPLILVESNVLSRPTDRDLVAHYARGRVAAPLLFRPIRVAVAAYEEWLHAPPGYAEVAARMERLLAAPPANFDSRIYVERARQEAARTDEPITRDNVERLKQLIPQIEARGTRVLLVELPQDPAIESAPYGATTRRIVREAFPDAARWLTIDVPRNELRWPDGVHMDERSALLVARAIEAAIR